MSARLVGTVRRIESGELRVVTPDGDVKPEGFGRVAFGPLQPRDVGKRVFMDRAAGVVSIENDEQRDARKARLESMGYTFAPAKPPAPPVVYVLATYFEGKLGASVWGSKAEALDAGAEWAGVWLGYTGPAKLANLKRHCGAMDAAASIDVIQTTGVL